MQYRYRIVHQRIAYIFSDKNQRKTFYMRTHLFFSHRKSNLLVHNAHRNNDKARKVKKKKKTNDLTIANDEQ